MSEPPEQEEEEAAAGADLEELLEQFREPEEAPRKRANPLWLISAILLSVLAGWLALRASGGSADDKPESAALAGAMLPGKTSERLAREEERVDVVKDYLARCKKGMTAQEVRWIVEDFQRAGLGEQPGSLSAMVGELIWPPYSTNEYPKLSPDQKSRLLVLLEELGRRQRDWYASTLIDGLRLDRTQVAEVVKRLRQLMSYDFAGFKRSWETYESETGIGGALPYYPLGIESFVGKVIVPSIWLSRDSYAPWLVCSLSPEQEAVTRLSEMEKEGLQTEETQADREDSLATTWLDQGTPFRSSLLSKREIHLADGDFGGLAAAGNILPLEESQLFEGEEFLRINDPTRLHPAQLKMLLLLEPERAAEILQALEQADK